MKSKIIILLLLIPFCIDAQNRGAVQYGGKNRGAVQYDVVGGCTAPVFAADPGAQSDTVGDTIPIEFNITVGDGVDSLHLISGPGVITFSGTNDSVYIRLDNTFSATACSISVYGCTGTAGDTTVFNVTSVWDSTRIDSLLNGSDVKYSNMDTISEGDTLKIEGWFGKYINSMTVTGEWDKIDSSQTELVLRLNSTSPDSFSIGDTIIPCVVDTVDSVCSSDTLIFGGASTYQLTVDTVGSGTGLVTVTPDTGGRVYASGTSIDISFAADPYNMDSVTATFPTNPLTVVIGSDTSIHVGVRAYPTYTVDTSGQWIAGISSWTITPGITSLDSSVNVVFTVSVVTGYSFIGFTDDFVSTDNPDSTNIAANITVGLDIDTLPAIDSVRFQTQRESGTWTTGRKDDTLWIYVRNALAEGANSKVFVGAAQSTQWTHFAWDVDGVGKDSIGLEIPNTITPPYNYYRLSVQTKNSVMSTLPGSHHIYILIPWEE